MATSVGLDLGVHHVRALVLRDGRVAAHAAVSRRTGDGLERPLPTVLAELAADLPIGRPEAAAASELDVLARFLHIAPLPPDRLERVLRLELSPEDGPPPVMDAVRLAGQGDDLAFLGLVVDAGAVKLLQVELARGGVRPKAISWGPMALAAAAMRVPLEGEQLALIIDIGAGGTDVALVGEGRLLACRRLMFGGEQFTQALVDTGLTPAAAEAAKLQREPEATPAPAPAPVPTAAPAPIPATEADALPPLEEQPPGLALDLPPQPPPAPAPEPEPELELELDDGGKTPRAPGMATVALASVSLGPQLTRAAEMFYGQLATTLAFFKAQLKRSQLAPAKVLLCGGGAGLPGLDAYLQRRFQVPVERWNPCDGLAGAPADEPWRWARALGLALAGSPADVPRVDLRPEPDLRREAWRRRLVWPWVAAACVLAAGAIAAYGLSSSIEDDRTETRLLEGAVTEHKRLSAELAKAEAERDALLEDLRAVAGRIYAARDLLYTIRALKEQTAKSKELWVTKLSTDSIAPAETAPERTAPGRGRFTTKGGISAPRVDTVVSRGAVVLNCSVRFDEQKKETDYTSFTNTYQDALKQWSTPEGKPLFKDVFWGGQDVRRGTHRSEVKGKLTIDGIYPFVLICEFPPTSLASEPAAAPEAAAP